jgi:integrase
MQVDAPFCPWCGAKQESSKGRKTRGNGTGTAFKKGKVWAVRVTVGHLIGENGNSLLVRRVKSGFKTKNEALAYAETLKQTQTVAKPNVSFQELYIEWRNRYEQRITHSTMLCYQAAFKHYSSLHSRRFVDILPGELQGCIDSCTGGKRTKENMKAFASLLYKYAIHNELIDKNRAETLYTGNDQKVAREAFTFDELERIWAAVPSEPYAKYVVCMCYLGFRPGEMLALKKTAYNPTSGCIIGGGKTKAGTDRPVPISPKIKSFVDEQMDLESEFLFPRLKDNKKMSDNYFREFCFDPLMQKLGMTNRQPYSCRHTFANLLKQVIGSDTDKAALMGHADASQTKYYQEADIDSLRKIVDMI